MKVGIGIPASRFRHMQNRAGLGPYGRRGPALPGKGSFWTVGGRFVDHPSDQQWQHQRNGNHDWGKGSGLGGCCFVLPIEPWSLE